MLKLSKRGVWLATAAIGLVILALMASWLGQHARRIHRLRQGAGDTVFYSADGRPWFSMDERRQDVPLADISPTVATASMAIISRSRRCRGGSEGAPGSRQLFLAGDDRVRPLQLPLEPGVLDGSNSIWRVSYTGK